MYKSVLKKVFTQGRYVALTTVLVFGVISFTVLLPNHYVIGQVLTSDSVGWVDKFYFVVSIYGSIATNFTILSAVHVFLLAILFGLNVSLLVYYIRKVKRVASTAKIHVANAGGLVSAALGIGCAACGSIILTTVLGMIGAGSLIAFLPFHGVEFGLLGILLLLWSTHYLIKHINNPLVCDS